jgi:hypothetical protein
MSRAMLLELKNYWRCLAAFVGLNLLQSALTNWWRRMMIFRGNPGD